VDVKSIQHAAGDGDPNLTVDTVVPYILDRGIVAAADIVRGDLEIVDVGRRNQNFKVIRREGCSYLLKQPGRGDYATEATIPWEAAFYDHCTRLEPYASVLKDVLVAFHSWDEDRLVLVLELIDGQLLWSHYGATATPAFAVDAAGPLGDALGRLHRVFRGASASSHRWMADLHTAPPWILFAHRPSPEALARLSPASRRVLTLFQRDPDVSSGMDELRHAWTTETLIHADLKGDNVLVIPDAGQGTGVRIVDWEMIQFGDPAWDVGNVLRDFVDYWLLFVPLSSDLTPEQMLDGAELPLERLRPAIRAFWSAYRTSADIDPSSLGVFVLRAVRFAAARMAQSAFELSASGHRPINRAIALIQLAANILCDPEEACLHLFGIPVPWRRTVDAAPAG
jgi:Ser/Thr protein kinase RdoA (MazF antagonist)